MPNYHEMRVDVKGTELKCSFYQKRRNGRRLVGQVKADRKQPEQLEMALSEEVEKIKAGKGSRRE